MLPRLMYSQVLPGSTDSTNSTNSTDRDRADGSLGAVVDFWDITRLLDAISLMGDSLPDPLKRALRGWFKEFLGYISTPAIKRPVILGLSGTGV